jgi:hypothetical protein
VLDRCGGEWASRRKRKRHGQEPHDRDQAHALLALEHIEQALDATCKGTDLTKYTIVGSSRLHASSSPVATFIEWCATTGITTEREFTDEVKRARKAAGLEE